VRVIQRRVDVVHAAGTDHHEQPVVGLGEDARDIGTSPEDDLRELRGQGQLVEEQGRRHQGHDLLDPPVADLIDMG
jgi:hypothetical protein